MMTECIATTGTCCEIRKSDVAAFQSDSAAPLAHAVPFLMA